MRRSGRVSLLTYSLTCYERALSFVAEGQMQTYAGRYKIAMAAFGRAECLARQFGDDAYLFSHLYGNRAIAYKKTGQFDKAIIEWEGAASLMIQSGQIWRASLYVNSIGYLLAERGELEQAEARLLDALEMIEQDKNDLVQAAIYDSLGYTYCRQGRYSDAEWLLNSAIRVFEKLRHLPQQATALIHLSELNRQSKRFNAASEHAARAIQLALEADIEVLVTEATNQHALVIRAELLFQLRRRNGTN